MNQGESSESCYYSVLGIHKDASSSEIRSAYRKLALKWHPDRWARNPSVAGEAAKWKFQKIQEAYSVLSDEGKKSLYDAGLLDLLEEDEGMGDFLNDLMKMMDQNVGGEQAKEEESLEDLHRTFIEMFGEDLAKMMTNNDPTVRRTAYTATTKRATAERRGGIRSQ